MLHLGKDAVPTFLACLPVQKITAQFEAIAEPLYRRIAANARENDFLAATRDLLLPKLMSGEIRVRDAAAELEAAQ